MSFAIVNSAVQQQDSETGDITYFPRTSRPVIVLTPIETCGDDTVGPESAHQTQRLPRLLPDLESIVNNCNEDFAGCCDDGCDFHNEWVRCCRCPEDLVNGEQYPGICRTCGGATTWPLPNCVTSLDASVQTAGTAGTAHRKNDISGPRISGKSGKLPMQGVHEKKKYRFG